MLNKFFKLELNDVSSKMLSFWEKDFTSSIDKHLDFLNENLENQDDYGLKFSEILENMDVFNSNNNEDSEDDHKTTYQDIFLNQKIMMITNADGKKDEIKDENQISLDAGFDLSDEQVDELLEY